MTTELTIERDDEERTVWVKGVKRGPHPEIGVFESYWEIDCEVELTPKEEAAAEEALQREYDNDL